MLDLHLPKHMGCCRIQIRILQRHGRLVTLPTNYTHQSGTTVDVTSTVTLHYVEVLGACLSGLLFCKYNIDPCATKYE